MLAYKQALANSVYTLQRVIIPSKGLLKYSFDSCDLCSLIVFLGFSSKRMNLLLGRYRNTKNLGL